MSTQAEQEWLRQCRLWWLLDQECRDGRAVIRATYPRTMTPAQRAVFLVEFKAWERDAHRPKVRRATPARNAAQEARRAELAPGVDPEDPDAELQAEKVRGSKDETLDASIDMTKV